MAKMAKDTQTDYTRGGKAISDTAIPVYQSTIGRLDAYLADPSKRLDYYLDKYYTNTATQDDFQRSYNRAMANATANNYAATSGGYSSAGQRAYDDQQRHMNDLYSRLRQYGIDSSAQLAQNEYNSLLNSFPALQTAYQNGQAYSDIERYNNMVDQNNSFMNQLGGILPTVGSAVGSLFGPVGSAVGNAIGSTAGGLMSTDTSGLASRLGGTSVQGSGAGAYGSMYINNPKTGGLMYNPNSPSGVFGMLSTGGLSNNRVATNKSSSQTLFTPAQLRAAGIDPNSI